MMHLLETIFIWLLAAFVLGTGIGWGVGRQEMPRRKDNKEQQNLLQQLGSITAELKATRSDRTRLSADLDAAHNQNRILQTKLDRLREDLAQAQKHHLSLPPEPEPIVAQPQPPPPAAISYPTQTVVQEGKPELLVPVAEPNHEDDLKEITGVGPFLEGRLHALGICTYKQIALLTPEMLQVLALHVSQFPEQVLRENWGLQTKLLHFTKYGEKL